MDIEDGYLIDRNRPSLRKIFQQHTALGSSHLLPFNELIKFASAVRIFPDLMSSFELKRAVSRLTGKHTGQDGDLSVTYLQFEKLIKHIAAQCFASLESDRLKLLLTHIRNACSLHYKVVIAVETKSDAPSPGLRTMTAGEGRAKKSEETAIKRSPVKSQTSLHRPQDVSLPSRAKEVSSKVQKLYALISPRASSIGPRPLTSSSSLTTSLRPSLTPDHPSTFAFHTLRPSPLDRESPFSPSERLDSVHEQTASNKEFIAAMIKAFKDFRENVTGTMGGKRLPVSEKVRKFVRTVRKFSFQKVSGRQKVVMRLSFRLWAVKTFRR